MGDSTFLLSVTFALVGVVISSRAPVKNLNPSSKTFFKKMLWPLGGCGGGGCGKSLPKIWPAPGCGTGG